MRYINPGRKREYSLTPRVGILLNSGLCLGSSAFFPLATNLVEAVSAEHEFVAQPPQDGSFFAELLVVECAGDVVGTLALLAVVDEMIFVLGVAQAFDGLGVHAGP